MRITILVLLTLAGIGCGYSRPNGTTQPGILPVVAGITPASQLHGGSDFTLMVTGSSFNNNAVVNWNGVPQANTAHPSANTLSVIIPATDIAAVGTAQVSVTNPGSTTPGGPYGTTTTPSKTSNNMPFTIN
jgi:hypothetical protein